MSIAVELGKAPSTIAYHVRALGVPPIKHFRALRLTIGKRRCSVCGRWKAPKLFPRGANPICTKCYAAGKEPPETNVNGKYRGRKSRSIATEVKVPE